MRRSLFRFSQDRLRLLRITGWVGRTRSRLFVAAALDVTARRCAPSPPALGAPRPLRLVKAPAAAHPLPQGERASWSKARVPGSERPSPAWGEG